MTRHFYRTTNPTVNIRDQGKAARSTSQSTERAEKGGSTAQKQNVCVGGKGKGLRINGSRMMKFPLEPMYMIYLTVLPT